MSLVPTPLPRYAARTPSVMMYNRLFPGLSHKERYKYMLLDRTRKGNNLMEKSRKENEKLKRGNDRSLSRKSLSGIVSRNDDKMTFWI